MGHKRSLVHRSRSMHLSSDCWHSSSLGASSKTVSMQPTNRQRASRAVSPFNTSTICATLAGSIVHLPLPAPQQRSVFMRPVPSSFLVVDVLPGGESARDPEALPLSDDDCGDAILIDLKRSTTLWNDQTAAGLNVCPGKCGWF
jgi:hypothetical protein